ncbi:hypothetical protein SDJN02_03982, partial [Cucurbita argyrosperma subsp. argyrosperma]
ATSKIVRCIFLATNELFRVEELAVRPSPDFINDCWLKIYKNSTRYMFSSTSLTEESVEGVITPTNCLVARHLSIGLQGRQVRDIQISVVHICKFHSNLHFTTINGNRDTFTDQINTFTPPPIHNTFEYERNHATKICDDLDRSSRWGSRKLISKRNVVDLLRSGTLTYSPVKTSVTPIRIQKNTRSGNCDKLTQQNPRSQH